MTGPGRAGHEQAQPGGRADERGATGPERNRIGNGRGGGGDAPRIVAVRSWRGGTGKSTVVSGLGLLLAGSGLSVAVVDTSLQAPGLGEAVGVDEGDLDHGLCGYLTGDCDIDEVPHDVSHLVPGRAGRLYLVPAAAPHEDVARPAFGRYDPGLLHDGFHRLGAGLELDVLLVDTHAGANYETLYTLAAADVDLVVARPATRERGGVRRAARFGAHVCRGTPSLALNMVPAGLDVPSLRRTAEAQCGVPVVAAIPHVAGLGGPGGALGAGSAGPPGAWDAAPAVPPRGSLRAAYEELAGHVMAAGPSSTG